MKTTLTPNATLAPIPDGITDKALAFVQLARSAAHYGGWVSYDDIAEAYTALTGKKTHARGVASSISSVQDKTRNTVDTTDFWVVPWHCIRYSDGTFVGTSVNEATYVADAGHPINVLFRSEFGAHSMIDNAARIGKRVHLAAYVRRDGLVIV
jgi:hypothetical protein